MPTHSSAKRRSNSNAMAARADPTPAPIVQPMSRPPTIRTASSTTELIMSAPTRPSETAELLIGIDRNLSVIPFRASADMAEVVDSTPNIIVMVSMPGSRKSM